MRENLLVADTKAECRLLALPGRGGLVAISFALAIRVHRTQYFINDASCSYDSSPVSKIGFY